MNYDVEPWYKLYIRESTEDKVLPVLNRALRDHLLRYAKSRQDPTILGSTDNPSADLARALGAHASEFDLIVGFVDSMLADGYLTHRKRRLFITNFVKAQEARSPGARRQKTYRDKSKKSSNATGTNAATEHNDTGTSDVTSNGGSNDEKRREETKRDEERRDDPTPARPPGDFGLPLTTAADELPDDWSPNPEHTAIALRLSLDLESEAAEYRAWCRREQRVCGNWDADFELWLRRSKRFARERAARRGSGPSTHGGPSDDWPTEADLSLRERIRAGEWPELVADFTAGKLDASLARRRIATLEARRRSGRGQGTPGNENSSAGQLGALAAVVGRVMP